MSRERRPCISEFDGYFNLNAKDLAIRGSDPKDAIQTSLNLPEFTLSEEFDFYSGLKNVIERMGSSISVPILGFGSNLDAEFTGIRAQDRTVGLECSDFKLLTIQFVTEFQSYLESRYPYWRIVLFHREPQARFVVYSDRIRFEKPCDGSDLGSSLCKAVLLEEKALDATEGSAERQLQLVKDILPRIAETLPMDGSPVVIASFDRWRGQPNRGVLWLFHNQESYHSVELDQKFLGYGQKFAISKNCELAEVDSLEADQRMGYLYEVVLRSEIMSSQISLDCKVTGASWIVPIPR